MVEKSKKYIWKSIGFTEEEHKALQNLANNNELSFHAMTKRLLVEGLKNDDLRAGMKILQQNYDQLHYELEMIQSTQEQHFIFLLVQLYHIMEYLGHPTEYNDKEPNAVEKAKNRSLQCRKMAFKEILRLATEKDNSDPLCVEEFFLKSSEEKAKTD